MKLLRPSEALLFLGLCGTAAAQVPCPAAYQKDYETELGLTVDFWGKQCAAGKTPEQILAEAKRAQPQKRVPPPKTPKNQIAADLGQTLQTGNFRGFYDGGQEGSDGSPVAAAGGADAKGVSFSRVSREAPLDARAMPYEQYHDPNYKKPGAFMTFINGLRDQWNFYGYKMTPQESRRMAEVKALLDSTDSGKALIGELGGWESVNRLVDLKFSKLANEHMLGATFPLLKADGDNASQKIGLTLSQNLLKEPPELVATILGHELTHVRDMKNFGFNSKLALDSEYNAHRAESYVFEELLARATPERRKELDKSRTWIYTKFVVALWQDKILQKYPTRADFVAQFPGGALPLMAAQAYEDLVTNKTQPGSPQLDYHVLDLYKTATDEEGTQGADKATLDKEAKLLAAMNARDDAFRQAHGFTIPAGVR